MSKIDELRFDFLNMPEDELPAAFAAQCGTWCAEWMETRRKFRDARPSDADMQRTCEETVALATNAASRRAREAWHWGLIALGIAEPTDAVSFVLGVPAPLERFFDTGRGH